MADINSRDAILQAVAQKGSPTLKETISRLGVTEYAGNSVKANYAPEANVNGSAYDKPATTSHISKHVFVVLPIGFNDYEALREYELAGKELTALLQLAPPTPSSAPPPASSEEKTAK